MKIAIIEDTLTDRNAAIYCLKEYFSHHRPAATDICYDEFSNREAFLAAFKPNFYSIILLDIYLPDLAGIEIAKQIRTVDAACQIILLTSSSDHLLEGYEIHAAGYILKPLLNNRPAFSRTLDYCLANLQADQTNITVKYAKNFALTILLSDIIYIACDNHRTVTIHTRQKNIDTNETYESCRTKLLADKRFLECYHRLSVNMDFIDAIEEDSFLLKNKESLPISRRKKTAVKQAYLQYFLMR